jgi:hypothetical protein
VRSSVLFATFSSMLAFAATFVLAEPSALANPPEPWSDADPDAPPTRLQLGDFGFRGGAEYRANLLTIRSLSLNDESPRDASWIEHRLRLDGTVDYLDKVKITSSVDALDGVLWGDNGDLGKAPESSSGANINSKNVNFAKLCMGFREGNPFDPKAYSYTNCPADTFFIRRLYGDVVTPIGLFRIGRQATTAGSAVALNDGDGRHNRFGFANRGNSVDRILFATKPLEAFKPKGQRDTTETNGGFLILAYDRVVGDAPQLLSDDVHQWVTAVRWLGPEVTKSLKDVELRAFHAYRWDVRNDTAINAFGGRAAARFHDLYAGIDATAIVGKTREVSEALRVITNDPAQSQAVRQVGIRGVVRYDRPKFSLYFESDYASGDADPQVGTPLTQFNFAPDSNVGLLMFKHTLAYQTGRVAAAATELLKSLKAPTIPVESVATNGAFTNAFAIFPQVDVRPIDNLLIRGGVLVAWSPAPVIDPIFSQQRRDGVDIQDDLQNFVGGKPGSFYGTELDARVQYRMFNHFAFDLEGAVLFPGDAFKNADGYAARSVLLQGRTTFFF